MAILYLLKEESMHGYQIMKELERRSGGVYTASAGTVYPALQELLEREMIDLDPNSDKKSYVIQTKGQKHVEDIASRREGDFWTEWEARWIWRNSDEAVQLKTAMELWEAEVKKAVKQARQNPEKSAQLITFLKEITERLQKENG